MKVSAATRIPKPKATSILVRASGGCLIGNQIARAYQRAMQEFKAKLLKDGLNAAEADVFVRQARVNGSISSMQGAADEYAAAKAACIQAGADEMADEKRLDYHDPQPLDSATRSYMAWAKAVEEGKFDSAAYARAMEQASATLPSGKEAQLEDVACVQKTTSQTFIGAASEKFVITKGVVLKGGPGSPTSYAKLAEENYTGHSYGGNAPIVDRISFLNDALVWVRDNTPLLDIMFRPEARGVIFYQQKTFEPVITLEPPQEFPKSPFLPQPGSILIPEGTGMSITAVQVENHSGEVLGIQSVWIDLHPANNNQAYTSKRAYPFDYPILTSPDFNVIQPGGMFRLNIEPVDVPPGFTAKVTINVQSESGRHAPIVQEIVP